MTTSYLERYSAIRERLAQLAAMDPAAVAAAFGSGYVDQYVAAARDQTATHGRIGAALAACEPERDWRSVRDDDRERLIDTHARVLAAMASPGWVSCPHLQRGGPQPAIALLALRRTDCRRCAARADLVPLPGEDDRCDLCGARGVTRFTPVTIGLGPVLAAGDVCGTCAHAVVPVSAAA